MLVPQRSRSVDDALDEVDDYEQTIGALIAFANIILHDYSGEAYICKVMRLSDSQERKITPDLVAEIGDYSLVAEIKKSLPRDEEQWDKVSEQISKYDKVLLGWSGNPKPHDLFLLCNQTVSYRAASYFQQLAETGKLVLSHNFCVLAFNRNSQRLTFMFLKKENGIISHKKLDERLTEGIPVPLELVLPQLSAVKFYDADPDVVYTMAVLWDHVLSRLTTKEKLRDSKGRKVVTIEVSVDHLLQELRTYFAPPSNREIVQRRWVKDAMEAFVKIGLADRIPEERDRYDVSFRKIETTIEFFAKKLYGEPQFKLEEYFVSVSKT